MGGGIFDGLAQHRADASLTKQLRRNLSLSLVSYWRLCLCMILITL